MTPYMLQKLQKIQDAAEKARQTCKSIAVNLTDPYTTPEVDAYLSYDDGDSINPGSTYYGDVKTSSGFGNIGTPRSQGKCCAETSEELAHAILEIIRGIDRHPVRD